MRTYPDMRMRRLRKSAELREAFSETRVYLAKMVMPLFVDENIVAPVEVENMPGIYRYPVETAIERAKEYEGLGIKAILLFGVPKYKDSVGSSSYDPNGVVQRAIKGIKNETDLIIWADLCLCEYTDHGHCGLIKDGRIDNDSTLDIYAKIATSYASAGVDGVAPSGMMDGQVARIRKELDINGYADTLIMAYSSKFASSLYAPFRGAVNSAPSFGDRKTYQMNFRNRREALREIEEDIEEGADIVMVKPALFYLDLVREARDNFNIPIAAYSVSAEYSMIKNAGDNGIIDLKSVVDESLTAIFRAGADIVISYFTEYYARTWK
ncbi:MAG: porphobilinogen synthase [Thermoplasmatales archaeon]